MEGEFISARVVVNSVNELKVEARSEWRLFAMCEWGQSKFESDALVRIGTANDLPAAVNDSSFFVLHISNLAYSRLLFGLLSSISSFTEQWALQIFPDWDS